MEFKNPSIALPEIEEFKSAKPKTNYPYKEITPAYFAFIDILGFKDTFESSKNGVREVFEYFALLTSQMQCLKDKDCACYAGQTSDSLFFYTNNIEYLICFINIFLHFNIFAMSKNIFFRGGISSGTLFFNEPYQFYGNCVINSFELESDIAKFPRIALDKKTYDDLQGYPLPWRFDDAKDASSEERHYINPFSPIVLEDISEYLGITGAKYTQNDYKQLKLVERKIKDNIKNYEFHDSTYNKYLYLLHSYRSFMEEK